MKTVFLLCFTLSLAACAPAGPSRYLVGMMQYQGASEVRLVDELGPPDSSYEVEGTKYLTYTKATQQIYNPAPSYGVGVNPRTGVIYNQNIGGNFATIDTFRCDVFFAVRNKQVVKVGHRGNAC